jgi:putative tricarboxylic transport membrane protein
MDLIAINLRSASRRRFSPTNLLYCFIGVFLGTFIGVLPGIGALAAVSMLLPVTFYLPATTALVMLAGVYYGAEYGGSIASILLNLPGTPSAAVTCLDGYPMAQQGRAGVALFMTTIASFVGASVGIVALTAFAPLLVQVTLAFGPAEYFAVMLLGLLAASAVSQGSPSRASPWWCSAAARLRRHRHQFRRGALHLGLPFRSRRDQPDRARHGAVRDLGGDRLDQRMTKSTPQCLKGKITFRSMLPTRDDVRRSSCRWLRGTAIGAFFGTLPGTGQTIASFIAYAIEKRVSATRALRQGRDRGDHGAGGGQQRRRADRLHPDADHGHSRLRHDGADAGRADDPRHHARPA